MKAIFIHAAMLNRIEAMNLVECKNCGIYYNSLKEKCDCTDINCPHCKDKKLMTNYEYLQCNNCGQIFNKDLTVYEPIEIE